MEYTVIHGNNQVHQYNSIDNIRRDIKGSMMVINKLGDITQVRDNHEIIWPADATVGLQAIVDTKRGSLRFGHDEMIGLFEFVISTYGDSGTVKKPKPKEAVENIDVLDAITAWPKAKDSPVNIKTGYIEWSWVFDGTEWLVTSGGRTYDEQGWKDYIKDKEDEKRALMSIEDAQPVANILDHINNWPNPHHPAFLQGTVFDDWRWYKEAGGGPWILTNGECKFHEGHWLNYHENKKKYSQPLGTKADDGKVMMGAIPPHAELAVARVLTFGAKKYSRGNWAHVENSDERYMDAALRHINAYRRGEQTDSETGENHLAHAICCLMFMLDKSETK